MASDRIRRGLAAATAAAVLGGLIAVTVPGVALAEDCPPISEENRMERLPGVPWAQKVLQAEKVWSLSKGAGVTVGVLDSGVQADHPLLDGQVKPGRAFIDKTEQAAGGDDATEDCVGHGTAVAGIIAGKISEDSEFVGVAPEAKILPVRIANTQPKDPKAEEEGGSQESYMTPGKIAEAIRWTADQDGVTVMNLSFKYSEDHDAVRSAIEYAIEKDIVVIAAGGNDNANAVLRAKPVYPADYPNVIGVGAVDNRLVRVATSQEGKWIDIVGPGANILAPQYDGNYQVTGATSMATAFVSGTAALLRSYHPDWDRQQIADQILKTASTVGGDNLASDDYNLVYGSGMVDPVIAMTEELRPDAAPVPVEPIDRITLDEEFLAAQDHRERSIAISVIAGAVGMAILVGTLVGVAAVRRGKRGKWRIRRADPDDVVETLDDGDPISLYQGIKGIVR